MLTTIAEIAHHHNEPRPARTAQHTIGSPFERRARALETRGDWLALVLLIEDELEFEDNPERQAHLWTRLADIHTDVLLDTHSAIDACQQALDADPEHIPALMRLEALCVASDRTDILTDTLEERLTLEPEDTFARLALTRQAS